MKLLKIILVVFLIYFIRRFIQMYKVVKALQENQAQNQKPTSPEDNQGEPQKKNDKVVEADFKVMD